MMPTAPTYFKSGMDFHRWLKAHASETVELWVGYYKVGSGKPSMTWPESVDAALCHGWIDGLRKSVDSTRYVIRFTPRKQTSTWSAVNIKRVGELIKLKMMHPDGLRAFACRRENRSGIYSYEQRSADLPELYASHLSRHRTAARYFAAQAPSYRKAAIWWVISAKQETTRQRRLAQLIDDCSNKRWIKQLAASQPKAGR